MDDLLGHRRQPFRLHLAGHADHGLRARSRRAGHHVQGHDELSRVHPALPREDRTMPGSEQEAVGPGGAPSCHPVGVAGEERPADPDIRRASRGRPEHPASQRLDLARGLPHSRRCGIHAIDSAQEVGISGRRTRERVRPLGQHRARRGCPRPTPGVQEHPGQARVERKPPQAPTPRGQAAVMHGTQESQKLEGLSLSIRRRRVEPVEPGQVTAPGEDIEGRACEVDPLDVGLAVRPKSIPRVPEPECHPRAGPPRASRTLRGRVLGDALGVEAVDPLFRIESEDLVQPRVHHVGDAFDGQGRLGDVGGQDDLASFVRGEGCVLLTSLEAPVEREHHRGQPGDRRQLAGRRPDLARAGEEAEDVAAAGGREALANDLAEGTSRLVANLDLVRPAFHLVDRAAFQVGGDAGRFGPERRGHHHHRQIRTRPLRLLEKSQGQVGVDRALVELVEDDRGELAQQGVRLEARGEHAFGGHQEARVPTELALEAHLEADLPAYRPSFFDRDPSREGARGHAARLE